MTAARCPAHRARSACARAAARAALSALGIAIGVASMVAVLGISESSKADLLAELDRLGTNLLRSRPASRSWATRRCCRSPRRRCCGASPACEAVAATAPSPAQTVRRNPFVDEAETGGISVAAADPSLRATVGATLRRGAFLNAATARYPAVVLGAEAASDARHRRRRRARLDRRALVHASSASSTRSRSRPQLDTAALIGFAAAASLLRRPTASRRPSTCAPTRTRVEAVRDLLGRDREPGAPGGGRGLAAVRRAGGARGGQDRVHLAVPRARRGGAAGRRRRDRERDGDLGARAALGDRAAPGARARRGATWACSSWPSRCCSRALGGVAGTVLGAAVTVGYASSEGWTAAVPVVALAGGVVVAVVRGRRGGAVPGAAGGAAVADGGAALLPRLQRASIHSGGG